MVQLTNRLNIAPPKYAFPEYGAKQHRSALHGMHSAVEIDPPLLRYWITVAEHRLTEMCDGAC
jgi:hypothetical protein